MSPSALFVLPVSVCAVPGAVPGRGWLLAQGRIPCPWSGLPYGQGWPRCGQAHGSLGSNVRFGGRETAGSLSFALDLCRCLAAVVPLWDLQPAGTSRSIFGWPSQLLASVTPPPLSVPPVWVVAPSCCSSSLGGFIVPCLTSPGFHCVYPFPRVGTSVVSRQRWLLTRGSAPLVQRRWRGSAFTWLLVPDLS